MKNFLKGFVVGVGKIIPGVSGAVLAIIMGIYDTSLYYINNFKQNKRKSIKYLLPIALGIIVSIIIFSKIIDYTLSKYYLMTMLFFVGLIIGGISFISKKVNKKNYYVTFITLVIFFAISITNVNNVYILKGGISDLLIFIFSGFAEAVGTVVPGISSTALLLIIGTYNSIISSISNITNISMILLNLKILLPFSIGFILGIFVVVKVLNILFTRYEKKTYSFILGVLLSSVLLLTIQSFQKSFTTLDFVLGIVLMVLGIFISSSMEKK